MRVSIKMFEAILDGITGEKTGYRLVTRDYPEALYPLSVSDGWIRVTTPVPGGYTTLSYDLSTVSQYSVFISLEEQATAAARAQAAQEPEEEEEEEEFEEASTFPWRTLIIVGACLAGFICNKVLS